MFIQPAFHLAWAVLTYADINIAGALFVLCITQPLDLLYAEVKENRGAQLSLVCFCRS